jgi:signal transduction histidine kinase
MRNAVAAAVMVLALCPASGAFAQGATKDECVDKCKQAAQQITDKGLDAAIAEINKKDGPFVWKDSYVFLMDLEGKMLAHPIRPDLIGKNQLGTPDRGPDKKLFFKEFVNVAKSKGEGWVDYLWPKPGADSPSRKLSYIYRVPGTDVFVGAGVYE